MYVDAVMHQFATARQEEAAKEVRCLTMTASSAVNQVPQPTSYLHVLCVWTAA